MSVRQKLSILFYPKGSKKSNDGKAPIYVRITIDGLKDGLSSGCKVLEQDWCKETKQVLDTDKDYKKTNKTLGQIKADLERHFDLMQAKHGLATPELVLESYRTPINGQKLKNEKVENLIFSEALDSLIYTYIKYCKKVKKAYEYDAIPSPEKKLLLDNEKENLENNIKKIVKQADSIFDNKNHQKTFVLATNEYLLNFLQLAFTNNRSPNSLEKMIGRKKRFLEFINYKYKKSDLPLEGLEYKFITDLVSYLIREYKVIKNTANKYAQCVKEITDRAVAKKWMQADIFDLYKCSYTVPEHKWPTPQELEIIENFQFKEEILNEVRDAHMFASYTGYAYNELHRLGPKNIKLRSDGELWVTIVRQKTKRTESVPLFPPAIKLIERYKNHPIAVRRNRLFPIPANQTFNRCLKKIVKIIEKEIGITIDLNIDSHMGRYYFANEVLYNNDVDMQTVSDMLAHESVSTTRKYVLSKDKKISDSAKMVKNKLFDEEGQLKKAVKKETPAVNQSQVINIGNPLRVAHVAGK